MEITQKLVSEIVKNFGLRPDKDLGQNFLIDTSVSEKIANSINSEKEDYVLEVGGGFGSITHFLVGKSDSFDVVDLDERMCQFLRDTYETDNINIINKDIRNVDVSPYSKIIGNLPYYITTELITFFLLNATKCKKMVFMIQTEAVNRFLDKSGKEYGAISVLTNLIGTPKRLFSVKPGCFYPMPKCGSTVFEINLKENVDREKMLSVYKMCKQLFLNRRKTLLNNLNNYTGNKEISTKTLQNLNILLTTRPEEISPETYVKIYDELKKGE